MLALVEAADTGRKTARLEARLSAERKALIDLAAKLQGVDLTEFAVAAATTMARETISRHEVTRLTPADHAAFAKALEAEPTDALVNVFRLHDEVAAAR